MPAEVQEHELGFVVQKSFECRMLVQIINNEVEEDVDARVRSGDGIE